MRLQKSFAWVMLFMVFCLNISAQNSITVTGGSFTDCFWTVTGSGSSGETLTADYPAGTYSIITSHNGNMEDSPLSTADRVDITIAGVGEPQLLGNFSPNPTVTTFTVPAGQNWTVSIFVRNNDASETHTIQLSDCDPSVLPAELDKLKATAQGSNVLLSWTALQQSANKGWFIQWLNREGLWVEIGWVAGHSTLDEAKSYSFIHTAPSFGMNYYRLAQLDYGDDDFTLSPMVQVMLQGKGRLNVYPNPVSNGQLTLELPQGIAESSLKVTSVATGQIVGNYAVGYQSQIIINTTSLPAGSYYATTETGEAIRFIVQ